ncbi:MAG: hemerythrin domain-containing protein [Gaiellales bacterium]
MERPPTLGEALFDELLWVHSMVRRDLAIVRDLAERVDDGLDPQQLRAELDALETTGPLWQLRAHCLHYCRFVHTHHRIEDIALFPALRRTDPGLERVIDRLQADHRRVSDLLDGVEAAARELTAEDGPESRRRVAAGLRELETHLLAHLALEEESVGPAIRRWEDMP